MVSETGEKNKKQKKPTNPTEAVHIYNPSTWQVEARGPGVQGHRGYTERKASYGWGSLEGMYDPHSTDTDQRTAFTCPSLPYSLV